MLWRYQGKCEVIHLACPDYNAREATVREAHEELARAYASVLREFAKADGALLRLAPISGGSFAGWLGDVIPALTSQALTAGWMRLEESEVEVICEKAVEVCVWHERELASFEFEFGVDHGENTK